MLNLDKYVSRKLNLHFTHPLMRGSEQPVLASVSLSVRFLSLTLAVFNHFLHLDLKSDVVSQSLFMVNALFLA